jgi:hypothetical protein
VSGAHRSGQTILFIYAHKLSISTGGFTLVLSGLKALLEATTHATHFVLTKADE